MAADDRTTAQKIEASFDDTWVAALSDVGELVDTVNGLGELRDVLTDYATGHPPFDVTLDVPGVDGPIQFAPEWDGTKAIRIRFLDGSALELPESEPAIEKAVGRQSNAQLLLSMVESDGGTVMLAHESEPPEFFESTSLWSAVSRLVRFGDIEPEDLLIGPNDGPMFSAKAVATSARSINLEFDDGSGIETGEGGEDGPADVVDGRASDRGDARQPVVSSVLDLGLELEVVKSLDAEATGLLAATTENLMGEVRYHLDQGSWSVEQGFDFGTEEDVERDLQELERQLRPLSGRPTNTAMVQGYVAQLSEYVLRLAQGAPEVSEEIQARIELLRADTAGRLQALGGDAADAANALLALESLAHSASWDGATPARGVETAIWEASTESATEDPAGFAARVVGWLPVNIHEGSGAVLGGLTAAGGIGFLAQGVANWAGATTTVAGHVGTVSGMVGAVAGAVLGVLAARFRPVDTGM